MKLTAMVFVTLDGVYQGGGGPDEDRRGGFDRGGWMGPLADEETGAFITQAYEQMDAMLLGRVTWDIWSAYWPFHHGDDPISHGINTVPRYVPSTTLQDPAWAGTHVIRGDVETAIRDLKAQPGRDLLLQGSGVLLRWLLEHDLVDELKLVIFPIVLGKGFRLFAEQGQTQRLELRASETTPNGVMLQTYRPAGRATFAGIEEQAEHPDGSLLT